MPPRSEMPPPGPENEDALLNVDLENLPVEDQIAIIISTMQDHPDDLELAQMGLQLLYSHLNDNRQLAASMTRAVEPALHILQHHDNHENLTGGALQFLFLLLTADMSQEYTPLSGLEQEERFVTAIVSVLNKYQDNQDIQLFGVLALMPSAEKGTVINVIIENDAIPTIFFALKQLEHEFNAQCAGIAFITSLLEKDAVDKVSKAGGLALLVIFLKIHAVKASDSVGATGILLAYEALHTMLSTGEDNVKASFVQLGGIKVLLDLLSTSTVNADDKISALRSLYYLADYQHVYEVFLDANGIQTLCDVLAVHIDSHSVVGWTFLVLQGLCGNNHEVADAFAMAGGFKCFFSAMNQHISECSVQTFALGAICDCIASSDTWQVINAIRANPNVSHYIVGAMHNHVRNEDVQVVAANALSLMAMSVFMCHGIVGAGGLQGLVAAMGEFPMNPILHADALSIFGTIVESGVVAESRMMTSVGGNTMIDSVKALVSIPYLIHVLHRFSDNDTVVSEACDCLHAMANAIVGVKEEIASAGGIKLLASIKKKASGEAQEKASSLLEYLEDSKKSTNAYPIDSTWHTAAS